MGAFGSTSAFGFAIGPLVGLQLRHHFGDTAMWIGFAAIAVLAGVTGAVAVRGHAAPEPEPVPVD
jgi:MFS family permease